MASTYEEDKKKLESAQEQATAYAGMQGLSEATKNKLGQLQQGYKPGNSVTQAQNYLTGLMQNKPGEYQSNYKQQLDNLYNQIVNQKPFQYDLNGDMLYQQYKDQYQQMGKQAMMDTMGKAATMTGGYGNSYASTVGNQAYQQHLAQLNSMIPEFYDRAANRYDQNAQQLMQQYSLTQNADAVDYARYADALAQWNADRNFGMGAYEMAYNQDYGQYNDALNYWSSLGANENADYWNQRNQAYQTAMQMLAAGKTPSADLLALAGLSEADANEIKAAPQVVYRSSGNPQNSNANLVRNVVGNPSYGALGTASFGSLASSAIGAIATGLVPYASEKSVDEVKKFNQRY